VIVLAVICVPPHRCGAASGEEAIEGAVPGWVHSLEALLSFADGSGMGAEEEEEQASSKSKPKETEAEGFGDAATGKVRETTEVLAAGLILIF